jgi:site-specific DNA-methyltransferase (adenine-specific)
MVPHDAPNVLYYGDNLDILRGHDQNGRPYIGAESVDLIYLDPPFNSDQDYNVLFADSTGARAAAQIKAFEDTWHWDTSAEAAYVEVVERGGKAADAMRAFRTLLGDNDMMAYLAMMAPRLIELGRVLKPAGSIYLHCDPTASHYLKLLMDAVFPKQFQNEIVWHYRGGGVSKARWGRRHDILLFYAKGKSRTFNVDKVRDAYSRESLERLKYKAKSFRGDKVYDKYEPHPLGKHPDDVWDMQPIMPSAKERLGYPTQKPERLLERIILASSNEGDLVLDPFCGCGTAVAVAQRLKRRWIGIDITHLAITLMKHRLKDAFGDDVRYVTIGEPVDMEGARALAREDPYQFQFWALGLLKARPLEQKKGADRGIDGRLLFHDEGPSGPTKQIIFSVKAGRVQVSHVRDLLAVVHREKASIGVLITMEEPTQPMRGEAAGAGFYDSRWSGRKHPRIQILTVEQIMRGAGIDYPGSTNVTFKRAPRARRDEAENIGLFEAAPARAKRRAKRR